MHHHWSQSFPTSYNEQIDDGTTHIFLLDLFSSFTRNDRLYANPIEFFMFLRANGNNYRERPREEVINSRGSVWTVGSRFSFIPFVMKMEHRFVSRMCFTSFICLDSIAIRISSIIPDTISGWANKAVLPLSHTLEAEEVLCPEKIEFYIANNLCETFDLQVVISKVLYLSLALKYTWTEQLMQQVVP